MNKDYDEEGVTTERLEAVKQYKNLMSKIKGNSMPNKSDK